MFDFSWSELLLVAVVGLLVIGPEELPSVIRNVKKTIQSLKNVGKDLSGHFSDIEEVEDVKNAANKINQDLKTIIDLDGNEQVTYDISEFLKDDNKKIKKTDDI